MFELIIINSLILIFWIFLWTSLQKVYNLILGKIISTNLQLSKFVWSIVRAWVIMHEFCHLIFGLVTFIKIKEVNLFEKNWWNVKYETRNYIWDLPLHYHDWRYWFLLFFHQIWMFLISIWPILIWVLLNHLLLSDVFWIQGYQELRNLNFFGFISMFFYSLLIIPSFMLSFQDIKNFIISEQENEWATIIWSVINTMIFFVFIICLSFFVTYFVDFMFLYLFWFFLLSGIFLFLNWIKFSIFYLKKLKK